MIQLTLLIKFICISIRLFWQYMKDGIHYAISIRELHIVNAYKLSIYKYIYNEETFSMIPIPNEELIRLQFCPKNVYAKTFMQYMQYTGRFKISYKVQNRLLLNLILKLVIVPHYFVILDFFAIKFHKVTYFISADYKHKVSIGPKKF